MDSPTLRHPTLYRPDGDAGVQLLGQRCLACGHVMFPRQPFGCEVCGGYGETLEPMPLAAEGQLVAFAQVHRHHGKDIRAPFVMAEIRLASGPFFRCTLAQSDTAGLRVGDALEGVLVPDAADAALELRFRPAGA